ncbi:CAP domain-containing protein [uncultured Amaricoccus sp.]|uniref:CAP domain-containing protein n=1 Tax=uncultured Amaricoccus sp. TaxID=339341 RepID=UPI0026316792|nr:CAP domain-containing protein [uncultured Amaricoccus sp.]
MRQVLSALALLCVALTGTEAAAAEKVPSRLNQPISPDGIDQKLFDEAVLIYSNAARRGRGLAPLSRDAKLARVASDQARNMAKLRMHSHALPIKGQSGFKERLDRQSLSYRNAGENIAMNKVYRLVGRPISTKMSGCSFTYGDTNQPVPIHTYATLAQDVVAKWLSSPKHRASLLSPGFRRLGSGVGVDPKGVACGDVYLVQDFAD